MINIKEDAKKMANLLKSGYTMLNLACPVCNNPIFRDKNGNTLCPICNRKVIFRNHEDYDANEEKRKIENLNEESQEKLHSSSIFKNLKQTAMTKLKEFTNLLENEKNPEICEKIINILKQLVILINEVDKFLKNRI